MSVQRGFLCATAASFGRYSRYLASHGVRTARAGSPATLTNSTMSSGRASASTRLKARSASPSSVTANAVPSWTADAPSAEQFPDPRRVVDAAGRDQRNGAVGDAFGTEEFLHRGQHVLEVEARVAQVLDVGGAQVPAGVAGMLDHDRIRQPPLARPLLDDQRRRRGRRTGSGSARRPDGRQPGPAGRAEVRRRRRWHPRRWRRPAARWPRIRTRRA